MARLRHLLPLIALVGASARAQRSTTPSPAKFNARDVFDLEWVSDPQISPDGRRVVFARNGYDIMKDGKRSTLWIASSDGSNVRPLLRDRRQASSPRWSSDGSRIVFASRSGEHTELIVRETASAKETSLTKRADTWGGITWSPDGKWIAFSMFVPGEPHSLARMPAPPAGANWGPPLKYIEKLNYRADGAGYLPAGYRHIFVVSANGGTPRQVTTGAFDDGPPVWTPDAQALVFSANRTAMVIKPLIYM